MGLVERRAGKAFQDEIFPELQSRVAAAAGCNIEVQADWASLQTEGYGPLYADAWRKVYFEPLIAALKAVTVDELGREAVASNLTSILIKDSGRQSVTFAAGELVLDYPAVANIEDGVTRTVEIQKVLERNL